MTNFEYIGDNAFQIVTDGDVLFSKDEIDIVDFREGKKLETYSVGDELEIGKVVEFDYSEGDYFLLVE